MKKPIYIFNKEVFEKTYDVISKNAEVYYPIKTNDSSFVVESLIKLGSKFEVDTVEHVRQLIDEYKISPKDILFNAILRCDNELQKVLDYGITYYVVDSINSIATLNKYDVDFKYLLRLSISEIVPQRIKIMKKWGVKFNEVESFLNEASNYNHSFFDGYSFYLSDEGNTPECRLSMAEKIFSILPNEFSTLNIGGSVPVEEINDYISYIHSYKNCKIIVEPGRPILNPSIDMVATVIETRKWGKNNFLYLNVGIYNGLMDAIIKKKHFDIIVDAECSGKEKNFLICGPTGDLIDNIGMYKLPSDIKPGDRLILKDCGAYCQVLITPFYCNDSYDVEII